MDLRIKPRREPPTFEDFVVAIRKEHALCLPLPNWKSSLAYLDPENNNGFPKFTVTCTCGGEWSKTMDRATHEKLANNSDNKPNGDSTHHEHGNCDH